jgi:hypothetical protein
VHDGPRGGDLAGALVGGLVGEDDGMGPVSSDRLVGAVLRSVTASWHEYDGRRSGEPMHLWLDVDPGGWVQAHCAGDGSLLLTGQAPYGSYDMARYGTVVVDPAGVAAAVTGLLGQRIRGVEPLIDQQTGVPLGIVLAFDTAAIGVANVADELLVAAWPSSTWSTRRIGPR